MNQKPTVTGLRTAQSHDADKAVTVSHCQKLGLLIVGLCLSLFLVEGAFRVEETLHRIRGSENILLPDFRLGFRIKPYSPGHDSLGFRNASVPAQADIVAIGDSVTWGVNAQRQEAWPQVLATLSNHTTYNMAVGGYGPIQYWVLAGEALKLSPKIIVVGLYLGNDIYDSYHVAYSSDLYRWLRDPDDSELSKDTITPQITYLFTEMVAAQKSQTSDFSRLVAVMGSHSAAIRFLYQLPEVAPSLYAEYTFLNTKRWALDHPDRAEVFDYQGVRTILTTLYRLSALDLDERRISAGLRITKEMLLLIKNQAHRNGVKVLVAVIPTKEAVCADTAERKGMRTNETYAKLIRMERLNRQQIMSFCAQHQIPTFDLLPGLSDAIESGRQIYPVSNDGHPNPEGYRIIASAINRALHNLVWVPFLHVSTSPRFFRARKGWQPAI